MRTDERIRVYSSAANLPPTEDAIDASWGVVIIAIWSVIPTCLATVKNDTEEKEKAEWKP
jgi:hypothetical protein